MKSAALIVTALLQSPSAPPELILADDFEDSYDGALYAWSSIEPDPGLPWWQRQWPIEDCVAYAARYRDEGLWECCGLEADGTTPRAYWTRSCGTNSGHRCNLLTGDEYLWVIFFSDFEVAGLACWDNYLEE